MRRFALIATFALLGLKVATAERMSPDVAKLHDELRALKQHALDAANKGDIDSLVDLLSPTVKFTAIDNELVNGTDQARAYEKKMLGGGNALISKMTLTAEPTTFRFSTPTIP